MVQQKICLVEDPSRQAFLQRVYDLLLLKEDSSYSRFILMHIRGERPPFLYEIFSSPLYPGVECALWPALYLPSVRVCSKDRTIVLVGKSPSCTSCCHPCMILPLILRSYSTSTTAGCSRPLLVQ